MDARFDDTRYCSAFAEQACVGALLRQPAYLDEMGASEELLPEDFYIARNREIFRAIFELHNANESVDVVTVLTWLEKNGKLSDGLSAQTVHEILENTPFTLNFSSYSKIVREKSLLRALAGTLSKLDEQVKTSTQSPEELIDEAEQKLFTLAERRNVDAGTHEIGSVVLGAVEYVSELSKRGGALSGAATGFGDFDNITSGLHEGELIVLAARPSMGKTAMALNIVEHLLMKDEKPALFFTMEMSAEQICLRLLSSLSSINLKKLMSGQIESRDWNALISAQKTLTGKPLMIDDTQSLTPSEVRSRARKAARKYHQKGGLGLIVLDYLQLMHLGSGGENRATEVAAISRSLKALARELNVPIIALSQLNRGLESRPNKRPIMSDLRESGAIEQDADLVLFIYRDEVYNTENPENKGKAELIIAKHRNGPTGMVRLRFDGSRVKFETPSFEEDIYTPEIYSPEG